MWYLKWGFRLVLLLIAAGFLHYTLPRHDVLRIVETEVRRVEVPAGALFWGGAEPADTQTGNRDVKFVSAVTETGDPRVFRNEDTGWGWPPYFKFDSADLQARAADRVSSGEDPRWVLVRYYGWRSQLFSIYPNVLNLSPASGPEMRVIPWFNIVVIAGLVALVLFVRWTLRRFWRNRIDPIVRDVTSAFDSSPGADPDRRTFRTRGERFREWWVELVG